MKDTPRKTERLFSGDHRHTLGAERGSKFENHEDGRLDDGAKSWED